MRNCVVGKYIILCPGDMQFREWQKRNCMVRKYIIASLANTQLNLSQLRNCGASKYAIVRHAIAIKLTLTYALNSMA